MYFIIQVIAPRYLIIQSRIKKLQVSLMIYLTLLNFSGFFMLHSVGITTPAPSKANAAIPNINGNVLVIK